MIGNILKISLFRTLATWKRVEPTVPQFLGQLKQFWYWRENRFIAITKMCDVCTVWSVWWGVDEKVNFKCCMGYVVLFLLWWGFWCNKHGVNHRHQQLFWGQDLCSKTSCLTLWWGCLLITKIYLHSNTFGTWGFIQDDNEHQGFYLNRSKQMEEGESWFALQIVCNYFFQKTCRMHYHL